MSRIAHIDGLRALAVLAVLAFHLGLSAFAGGFVGVDVFYVISGYLITGMILRDLDRGKFGFLRFYSRRAVRLLPALFVTVALCLPLSALLFTPADMESFAHSAIASVFAYSNFLFWWQSGYFDAESITKPLLHTWSLSVEWQFYAVWPALLWATARFNRRLVLPVIVLATAISLTLVWWYRADPQTVFYLMPFRIFQFGIGAIVLWLPVPGRLAEPLLAAGLALIAYSVFGPAIGLWPAVGAALAIYAGSARFLGAILSNPVAAYVGRISYSVYLVHWPMIVFWRYYVDRAMTHPEMAVLSALSLLGGAALYHAVEKPFHEKRILDKGPRWVAPAALVASLILISGPALSATDGWAWRIAPENLAKVRDPAKFHKEEFGGAGFEANTPIILGSGTPAFILAGDSHGQHFAYGLDKVLKDQGRSAKALFDNGCFIAPGLTRFGTSKPDHDACAAEYPRLLAMMKGNDLPLILASSWLTYRSNTGPIGGKAQRFKTDTEYRAFIFSKILEIKKDAGSRPIYLVGDVPGSGSGGGIIGCILRPTMAQKHCIDASAVKADTLPIFSFNEAMKSFAATSGMQFVDSFDVFCQSGECPSIRDGQIMYSDAGHLSKAGSLAFAERFVAGFLPSPLAASN